MPGVGGAVQWRRRELAVIEKVDRAYYFSAIEIEELGRHVPQDKLQLLPLFVMDLGELPQYSPSHRKEMLFVGGYNHPPNVDAAMWLANEILPRVIASIPGARLHLVGSNPPASVLELASEHIEVHGYISDAALQALYRRVGAAVVPLQYGAGVKGKVVEAVAAGVPVVTTDVGAEGIPDAEDVMWIENSAETIASRLSSLLGEAEDPAPKLNGQQDWLANHFDKTKAVEALKAGGVSFQ